MKRLFTRLPKYFSVLFISVFLFASITSIGSSVSFCPASAEAQDSGKPTLHRHDPLVREAMEVHHRHVGSLMHIPDVVGTGVGIGPDGLPVIEVFTARHGVSGIPEWLESIPVHVEVTGMIVALESDPTLRYRPAPIGVSTGHPDITAGTIGARVKDADGNVYALSNNHVYANQNEANIGDSALQPGDYDGGKDPADKIGALSAFEPIDFTLSGKNYIDAAIVKILDPASDYLANSTPPDDMDGNVGYGRPGSMTKEAYIGLDVQKYGRTTGMTHGEVSAIDVSVKVCYELSRGSCTRTAYFYDQIRISAAGFSGGGDSGSLVVTDDANKNPVGLLFAGSYATAIANRIQRVQEILEITIDGNYPPNADFSYAANGFTVSFTDGSTDSDGAITSWNWDLGDGSTSTEQHPTHVYTQSSSYVVTLAVTDNDGSPNTVTKSVIVGGVHVGDMDGKSLPCNSTKWNGTVTIEVHDPDHNPVSSATVKGSWKVGTSTRRGSCKTGTNGRCSIKRSRISYSIPSATFTLNNITHSGMIYNSGANHDSKGDGNGTTVTIDSYPRVTLLSPNGGETLESGRNYPVTWEAAPEAVKFRLRYSIDNGLTWLRVHTEPYVLGTTYTWTVPALVKNKPRSLMEVMEYNSKNVLVGSDRSDEVFTLEVLTVTSPVLNQVLSAGGSHTIRWEANATDGTPSSAKLLYTLNGGISWKSLGTTSGNPGSFTWGTLPTVLKAKTQCRIKVLLKDSLGATIASALSPFFVIQPGP